MVRVLGVTAANEGTSHVLLLQSGPGAWGDVKGRTASTMVRTRCLGPPQQPGACDMVRAKCLEATAANEGIPHVSDMVSQRLVHEEHPVIPTSICLTSH